MYILCAVPARPICSRVAISRNESPIPARCQTTVQPMSDEYAAVRAGSADVLLSAMFTNLRGSCSKSAGGRCGVTTAQSHAGTHVRSEMKLTVRAWHDCSFYIAGIPASSYNSLTVKLSPCPCSHSSPAERIAARLWAFQMQFANSLRLAPG